MISTWHFPTRIEFGPGATAQLGERANAVGIRRALVVTDSGVQGAGILEPILKALAASQVETAVYAGVHGNPIEQDVVDGVETYCAHGADGVVAVGGGSAMDAAKLIALKSVNSHPLEELDDARGGDKLIGPDVPPVLAVPTTSGTGSEVARAAVVTLKSSGRKTVIFSPHLLPRAAILDPELAVSAPPELTAAAGLDALTHCIEAYLSKGEHPMADAIALAGVDRIANHLPGAVADGTNLIARGAMMQAATMGAVAFQKGLGACHSLAHPLSSQHGVHHGLANALCLPAVLDFNEAQVPDRVIHVGVLMGAEMARGACSDAVRRLRQKVGLPGGLADAGIEDSALEALADLAMKDGCHRENPRLCSRDDMLALYRASM